MTASAEFVPCTRLTVRYRDDGPELPVGELARARTIAFQYDAAWLARDIELSPEHLPRSVGREIQLPPGNSRLHGLFADALPDAWGERMMRMAFQRAGVSWDQVGELDRLSALGAHAIGALSFASAPEPANVDPSPSIDALVRAVDELLRGDTSPGDAGVIDALLRVAGFAGGAQPKVLVGVREEDGTVDPRPNPAAGYTPYLVKFSPRETAMNLSPAIGAIELAYAHMAGAAGLTVPATRLLQTGDGRTHFAARRFDRTPGGGRRHVHSLAGLLGRPHSAAYDYDELLKVAVNLTGDQRAIREAFARGLFNVLTGNDDDHGRNTSFLLDPRRGWMLSPAYDLVFQPGRGSRGMTILGKEAGITLEDFRMLARRNGIVPGEVEESVDRVMAAIGLWPDFANAAGVPGDWQREISLVMAERTKTFGRADTR